MIIDLVRSAITFETVAELHKCLQAIAADPTVCILGLKNRFALDYDSAQSAGYRNLALNIVVVDRFSMLQGVERHVCELQLGLKAFDDLKNEHGHQLYVQWRDARAD